MVLSNSNRPPSPQLVSSFQSASSISLQNPLLNKLFSENFWGDKINGFDILCSNLKHSLNNVKELEMFLRECANCEDSYGKALNKIVLQINKFSVNGTFNPLWIPLKEINERYALMHIQFVHQLQELIKDLQRYNDELSRKIKKIRENEIQTQNVVQSFQEIYQNLNKTKDQYHNICIEFEKQKKQLDSQQLAQYLLLSQHQSSSNLISPNLLNNTNTNVHSNNQQNDSTINSNSASDRLSSLATSITANKVSQTHKLEKKMKLALEDYKTNIEKYNLIRNDFERKLADSCNHFQYAEETHLKQMRLFVESYCKLIANLNENKQKIHNEFNTKISEQFTVDFLIQLFIENKKTGTERPEVAHFIEHADYIKISNINQSNIQSNQLNEADFNLVITNNSTQLVNNSTTQSNLQLNKSTIDSIDGKGSDYSILNTNPSNNSLRGTPVFFSTSNLISTNSIYSQLNNETLTTNNVIQSFNNTNISNSTCSSSINLKESSGVISPSNGSSSTSNSENYTAIFNASNKKSDSKGLNIFNVDFLGRNKNKEKKAAQKANIGASATTNDNNLLSKSKFSRNKKSKQNILNQNSIINTIVSDTTSNLISLNNHKKDSNSYNSDDFNETHRNLTDALASNTSPSSMPNQINNLDQKTDPNNLTAKNSTNYGNMTTRSISSITGSISFDLLDQLKLSSNGNISDIDSEGFSIRPDSSIDLRKTSNIDKNNDGDMNNLYGGSSTDSDSDSDSENGNSIGGPVKVMLKIKPKCEFNEEDQNKLNNNTDVLREISKNLQLKPPGFGNTNLANKKKSVSKTTYYYNYGTCNFESAYSNNSEISNSLNNNQSSTYDNNSQINSKTNNINIIRSVSAGNVLNNIDISSSSNFFDRKDETINNKNELIDQHSACSKFLGLEFDKSTATSNKNKNIDINNLSQSESIVKMNVFPPNLNTSMSLSKVNENNCLYNIDEDKEVESSFHHNILKKTSSISNSVSPSTTSYNNAGRFTPACFPGRTTPDFCHSASTFEQQSTRASIMSPLTIIGGSEIIPIAIAFNETIHAYFKIGDTSKFKVKCFGSMKISFPFAILKLLAIEIPHLEYRLHNLDIANQDLKINSKLLMRKLVPPSLPSFAFDSSSNSMAKKYIEANESLDFSFIQQNLITELKQQHQKNKQAAFFNFELLKYEFKYSTTPLVLKANWSKDQNESTIKLDLEYLFKFHKNLSQVNFMVVMPCQDAKYSSIKIKLIDSEPKALIQENDNKFNILWQMSNINADGHIMAKFDIKNIQFEKEKLIDQPQSEIILEKYYQPVYTKYHIDNETLSKERVETGKYFCNYDQQQLAQMQQSSSLIEENNQVIVNNQKKPPFAGSLSTTVGSSVELINY